MLKSDMLKVFPQIILFQSEPYKQVWSGRLFAVSRTLRLKEFGSAFSLNITVFTGIQLFLSENKNAAVKMA